MIAFTHISLVIALLGLAGLLDGAKDLQWCSSNGHKHVNIRDLIPDEEDVRNVGFSFTPGIEMVRPEYELPPERRKPGEPAEEYTVHFNSPNGVHQLNVSYLTMKPGEGGNVTEGEEAENLVPHSLSYTIKQLECDYAVVYPQKVNETHAKVNCGLKVKSYGAPVIWKKNGALMEGMRNQSELVFETNDPSVHGNYTCAQTFLGDILTKTIEFFHLGAPGSVRVGHVHCEVTGKAIIEGRPVKFCVHPVLKISYHRRQLRNANVVAFQVSYKPRTGPSYNETVLPIGHHTLEPLQTTFVFPGVLTTRAVNSYGLYGKPHVEILMV